MGRLSLCFVVESGTDVRLVEGLAERFDLTVMARDIPGGVPISRTPRSPVDVTIGPPSRTGFARLVWKTLDARRSFDAILVQGYALAALAAHVSGRLRRGRATFALVCSPVERYYDCRRRNPASTKPYRPWEHAGLRGLAAVNARLAQHYIVLSRHLADVVRSHGARCPISIIPLYGVDTRHFAPAAEPRAELRRRLGLPQSSRLILFSSRVAPEKDSETLLRACRLLLEEGRDIHLLHRSGGYLDLVKAAERLGVSGHLTATDAIHPLGGLALDYQAADVCVQASLEEGLGFSVLEAFACGTPVVAAAVGGLRETVLPGETGWAYPAGDAAALAQRLREVLDRETEAQRRAANGRVLVLSRYEQGRVFDAFGALVLDAVQRLRRRNGGEA